MNRADVKRLLAAGKARVEPAPCDHATIRNDVGRCGWYCEACDQEFLPFEPPANDGRAA